MYTRMLVLLFILLKFIFSKKGLTAYIVENIPFKKALPRIGLKDRLDIVMLDVIMYKHTWICYVIEPYLVYTVFQLYGTYTFPELCENKVSEIPAVESQPIQEPWTGGQVLTIPSTPEVVKAPIALPDTKPVLGENPTTAVSGKIKTNAAASYDDSKSYSADAQSADSSADKKNDAPAGSKRSEPADKKNDAPAGSKGSELANKNNNTPAGIKVSEPADKNNNVSTNSKIDEHIAGEEYKTSKVAEPKILLSTDASMSVEKCRQEWCNRVQSLSGYHPQKVVNTIESAEVYPHPSHKDYLQPVIIRHGSPYEPKEKFNEESIVPPQERDVTQSIKAAWTSTPSKELTDYQREALIKSDGLEKLVEHFEKIKAPDTEKLKDTQVVLNKMNFTPAPVAFEDLNIDNAKLKSAHSVCDRITVSSDIIQNDYVFLFPDDLPAAHAKYTEIFRDEVEKMAYDFKRNSEYYRPVDEEGNLVPKLSLEEIKAQAEEIKARPAKKNWRK